jgi:hypothetical protein
MTIGTERFRKVVEVEPTLTVEVADQLHGRLKALTGTPPGAAPGASQGPHSSPPGCPRDVPAPPAARRGDRTGVPRSGPLTCAALVDGGYLPRHSGGRLRIKSRVHQGPQTR